MISGRLPEVAYVGRSLDLEGERVAEEGTGNVGSRHRSAYRLCAALPGSVAIVISQDGGVRFVCQRDNRVTSVWVGARYEEGTSGDYIPLVTAALEHMDFPYGYSYTFRDWEERRREQSREFLVNLLLALLLVYAVMAGVFESARQAIGLMVALPFALAGAVWTLYLTKTDFDQPAAIGLLLLIGVVVNNGIVMLEHINQYRRRGMSRHDAMLRGGRERLRPIVMTAITTLVGLVPIVVQKPALAGIYYYSMALVIMGGLLVSTFLTSVRLPTTASLSEDLFAFLARLTGGLWRLLRGRRKSVPDTP